MHFEKIKISYEFVPLNNLHQLSLLWSLLYSFPSDQCDVLRRQDHVQLRDLKLIS